MQHFTIAKDERQRFCLISLGEYLKLFEPRERLAIEIAGWLGTRRSERFGLKWRDIDLERGVVTFRQASYRGASPS